jgi:hypothetical protein
MPSPREQPSLAISVPREPQILSAAVSYFNERVRGDVPRVDEGVLAHEIGVPFSYATRADRDARIDEGDALYSAIVTVGVGGGLSTVTVSRSVDVGFLSESTADELGLYRWVEEQLGPVRARLLDRIGGQPSSTAMLLRRLCRAETV